MKTNDLNLYPPGAAPATGPAGNVFADPVFGTSILRVSDEKDNAGEHFANAYSAIYDGINADSTRIAYLGMNGSSWIADLDVAKKKVSNKRRIQGFTYWSRVDPNVCYQVANWEQAKINRYDAAADKWSTVVDLAPLLPAFPMGTGWIDSRGMSWDDNRFHISTRAAEPENYVYDVKAGKLVGPLTLAQALKTGWKPNPPDAAYLFGKSTMDSSGTILWTADTQLILNVDTGASFVAQFGTPGPLQYGDVHSDSGPKGLYVACGGLGLTGWNSQNFPAGIPQPGDGFYPFVATLDPHNLSSYLDPRRRLGPRFFWGFDSHTSFRDSSGQWVTFCFDGAAIGADAGKPFVFDGEILQLSLASPPDGSVNRRIAHHHSDPSQFTPAKFPGVPQDTLNGWAFWASPHASQSQSADPAKQIILFNSTYQNKRIDVYVAFLELPSCPAGIPGPMGPQGPAGPPGPQGPKGESGLDPDTAAFINKLVACLRTLK
jgi:hypothetical protein